MRVWDPRHNDRVQLQVCAAGGVCVRSGTRQCDSRGACVSGGCVRRRVRRAGGRAGGLWGRRARGARSHRGGAMRRAMCYAAVLPGFARSPRAERLWANSWGSATQHDAGCGVQVCEGVGSRGVAGAGCDGAARAADAVSAAPASPWCGARWGVAMAVGSAPERRSTLSSAGGEGRKQVPTVGGNGGI